MEIINKTEDKNVYEWDVHIDADLLDKIRRMAYLKDRWLFLGNASQVMAPYELLKGGGMDLNIFNQDGVRLLETRLADFIAGQEGYPENLLVRPSVVKVGNEDETGGLTVTLKAFGKADVELGGEPDKEELEGLKRWLADTLDRMDDYVEAEIESQRYKNVRLTPKDSELTAQDYANLDLEVWILDKNGQPHSQYMSQNINLNMNPLQEHTDVENGVLEILGGDLMGKKAGESVEKDFNGIRYSAIVNTVYEAEVPDADDDFAVEVSEYDTMDEYREGLREDRIDQLVDAYNGRLVELEMASKFTGSKVDFPSRYGGDRERYIKNIMTAMENYFDEDNDDLTIIKPYRRASKNFRLEGLILGSLLVAEKILQEEGEEPGGALDLLEPEAKELLRDIFRFLRQKNGTRLTNDAQQYIWGLYSLLIGELVDFRKIKEIFKDKVEMIDRDGAFAIRDEVKRQEQEAQEAAESMAEQEAIEDVDELEEAFLGSDDEDLEEDFFGEENEELDFFEEDNDEDLEEEFFGFDDDEDDFFDDEEEEDLEEEFFGSDDDEDDFFDDDDEDLEEEFFNSDDGE